MKQDSVEPSEAEVLRAHAPPQGPCDGLVVALKLPASLQKGADNLMDTILEALQEHSRSRITNELRRFIEVNNHEAVKIGDSAWNAEAIKVSPTSRRRSSRTRPSGKRWTTRHVRNSRYAALLHRNRAQGRHRSWTRIGTQFFKPRGRRGSGMGELVLQVCGDNKGGQCSNSKWKQQGEDVVESERCQKQM